jgi:C4-dicarboxylate transporter DctM subunit
MAVPHAALLIGLAADRSREPSCCPRRSGTDPNARTLRWRRDRVAGHLPLVLLAVGTPVFLVFLTAVVVTMMFVMPSPPVALQQVLFGGLDNYALLAIPFFVFAGELMSTSGIANRLINWATAMVGRVPGSLGVATVGASTAIGAISGSSVAAVAALGKTLYPKLVASGYGKERAGGLLASSGAIDIAYRPASR